MSSREEDSEDLVVDGATVDNVKSAYRKSALKNHPGMLTARPPTV